MQRSLRLALLALPSLFLGGCLLSQDKLNEPISGKEVRALQPGMSATEVVASLGAPAEVVEIGQRTAYRFEYARTKNTGLFLIVFNMSHQDTRSDRVWCFFDAEDRLTHMASTLDADDVSYTLR
jgi:hypothetical protein